MTISLLMKTSKFGKQTFYEALYFKFSSCLQIPARRGVPADPRMASVFPVTSGPLLPTHTHTHKLIIISARKPKGAAHENGKQIYQRERERKEKEERKLHRNAGSLAILVVVFVIIANVTIRSPPFHVCVTMRQKMSSRCHV